MRGDLFGANSLEQESQVIVMGLAQGRLFGVVGMNIALFNLVELVLIVTLAVLLLINWLMDVSLVSSCCSLSSVSFLESLTD